MDTYDRIKVQVIQEGVNILVSTCHEAAVKGGWWHNHVEKWNPITGATDIESTPKDRNIPELLCLIHSEISEGMEGYRKNLQDTHLPHRKMLEVELADAMIRIADLAGGLKLDIAGAILEKLEYNAKRADHKAENRIKDDGKKF